MAVQQEELDFQDFVRKFHRFTNIDLSQYKEAQMKRRLTTLRTKNGFSTFASYYDELIKDKALLYEFLDRMTINVSEFWRNPNRWQVFRDKLIPEMAHKSKKLKIWSAACSTGEEPYTIAMILAEKQLLSSAYLLATDIDAGALEKSNEGVYLARSLKEVPEPYLKKYFREVGATYHISGELKRSVNFRRQNLLVDPFESGFDLIVCRNVTIYFTEEAKHQLYHKFAKALKPDGLLFVGSTEQIFSPAQYGLQPAETFFYRKINA